MTLEQLRAALKAAIERMHEASTAADTVDERDGATDEERAAAHTTFVEARDRVDALTTDVEQREARQRAREQHVADTTGGAERARVGAEEPVHRQDQRGESRGFFLDLALAKQGDNHARDRLTRSTLQAEAAQRARDGISERAGDLTSATHMGEFIPPQWTNDLYAQFLRAGRPFADQCVDTGEPQSSVWSLPRITTGASAAIQTEGSAASNTDHVSDSISAALLTPAGFNTASYQLVDLAQPGMDQIIYQDLLGALNQQVDIACLNSSTTNAKGVFQLSGTNAVTYTDASPTGPELWPTVFQGKSGIEKGTFLEADFSVWHPSTWNWYLSSLDTANRPLALATEGAAFNNMALYNPKGAQGIAGNIGGIPVVVDANVPVNLGGGTNQSEIGIFNRSGLLKKESAPRFKAADQTAVTSLMWTFVMYEYLQIMFGRHPKKISVIGGTGLIVQSGF